MNKAHAKVYTEHDTDVTISSVWNTLRSQNIVEIHSLHNRSILNT